MSSRISQFSFEMLEYAKMPFEVFENHFSTSNTNADIDDTGRSYALILSVFSMIGAIYCHEKSILCPKGQAMLAFTGASLGMASITEKDGYIWLPSMILATALLAKRVTPSLYNRVFQIKV